MPQRPNILLIATDHWPAHLMNCAGHGSILTPTLDQLAHNGVRFTNAYSECPVCIPARRSLMTGTTPRTHNDRVYLDRLPMPDPAGTPTLAQCFRDAGYQAHAVGKLHVYPQRNRIGFDDVVLVEEGRTQFGVTDDYEMFLGDRGYAGRQWDHGISNNSYESRPWHLPEDVHPTNFTAQQMARQIKRRDRDRPGFWYLSFTHPHPPLTPLQAYLDMYRDVKLPDPAMGGWSGDAEKAPYPVAAMGARVPVSSPLQAELARRAFYALCTHIDHQIRLVIGTLREEGLAENTIVVFTSDHGDMLGDHGVWGKRVLYEGSANVPLIVAGAAGSDRVPVGGIDDRLVCLRDIMPTLLDLAGLTIPSSVEGVSMLGPEKREYLYGEISEGPAATRMIHDGRHKLIYYPNGNLVQLFDLDRDPRETMDVAGDPGYAGVRRWLESLLISELYGGDEQWVRDGQLAGVAPTPAARMVNRGFSGLRGSHWPPPLPGKGE